MRAKLPIIIMGETGIGKTALLNFIKYILDYQMMTLNVHAGI
jgi:ABC-type lipoprotein export system ATPase subunit